MGSRASFDIYIVPLPASKGGLRVCDNSSHSSTQHSVCYSTAAQSFSRISPFHRESMILTSKTMKAIVNEDETIEENSDKLSDGNLAVDFTSIIPETAHITKKSSTVVTKWGILEKYAWKNTLFRILQVEEFTSSMLIQANRLPCRKKLIQTLFPSS
ncbi:hypothetical protein RF11_15901 [Thelohanellus kitauei]|uniref:Uncharacterized protein n=1 Tax=Thelohanellus kitauei TaxID=669202 RepID=A0A0C2MB69_THEKT|nr:hypothetical protein RF11_15901 [Thelohanellus kitauei]